MMDLAERNAQDLQGGAQDRYMRRLTSAFSEEVGVLSANASSVTRVLRYMLERIDRGEYVPGGKINTLSLAKDLGLSRAPIREALHTLAGMGVVALLPDRGAVLRPFDPARLMQTLEVLDAIFGISLIKCAELYQDPKVISALSDYRGKFLEEDHGAISFYMLIHDFHFDVSMLSAQTVCSEVISSLNIDLLARTFADAVPFSQYRALYQSSYVRLIDSLLEGDGASARTIFAHHIRRQIRLFSESGQAAS